MMRCVFEGENPDVRNRTGAGKRKPSFFPFVECVPFVKVVLRGRHVGVYIY
jgi:hypothetical protein